MRAACSSKRPGRRHAHRARCALSSYGVRSRRGQHVAAVATARKLAIVIWHLLMTKQRELRLGHGLTCMPRSCATSNSRLGQQGCARPEGCSACLQPQEPPRRRAALGGAGRECLYPLCRRLEPARSEDGAHGCRKVRGDDKKAARQGFLPQTLLFATRSSVRNRRLSQIHPKSSCRSHQWCVACMAWFACGGCRDLRVPFERASFCRPSRCRS